MMGLAFVAESVAVPDNDVTVPTARPFMAIPASATAAAHTVRPLASTDSMLGGPRGRYRSRISVACEVEEPGGGVSVAGERDGAARCPG
jgi:hypothetical protein